MIATIEVVVNRLAPGFVFGWFTVEDIKQEIRAYSWKALRKYDGERRLENFLCRNARNRMINFKRDNFHRADPPCKECEKGWPNAGPHNGEFCPKFIAWLERNGRKQGLSRPLHLETAGMGIYFREESRVVEECEGREMEVVIDNHLPIHLRADYLRMRDGLTLTPIRRAAVAGYVQLILSSGNLL